MEMSSDSDMETFEPELHLNKASLHLPIHAAGEVEDGPTPGSLLLDFTAYIDDRRNATTAWSKTRKGHRVSVTLWPARPPRISYFSVYCPDLKPGDYQTEPAIIAADDDLVLLYVVVGPNACIGYVNGVDYFVYQARGGHGAAPSLELLKRPYRVFDADHAGLMRCRRHPRNKQRDDSGHSRLILERRRPQDDDGFYVIAALWHSTGVPPGLYDLHVYDSRTKDWSTRTAVVRREQERVEPVFHFCTKVIAVGGDKGTMGWVDFKRSTSILFCDVLQALQDVDDDPELRRVALPATRPSRPSERDVAVVGGRVKYAEFDVDVRPGSAINATYIADDWTASIWTMNHGKFPSQTSCKASASQISVADGKQSQFELLPKLFDDQGVPQPTLQRLHTSLPALSLDEDGVLYLMAKVNQRDTDKAFVLCIDVKNRMLQGATEFGAQRMLGLLPICICCKISQHLHMASGHLKRPGSLMRQPYLKKPSGVFVPLEDLLERDGEQKHQDTDVPWMSLEDNMDLA